MVDFVHTGNFDKLKSHHLTTKGEIGLIFNTDGVSPFKSSLLTIWPFFVSSFSKHSNTETKYCDISHLGCQVQATNVIVFWPFQEYFG